ncbi:unnamed protein product [Cylicocyclus nassatus]|uniref:Uncharacterized protein n=1 Tax=Cylicocyclus nassatus TaxID=53992 RepID=A0AA36H2K2_CYLNA|nr:unnamed protein product [Cylicocyclus nassatus]
MDRKSGRSLDKVFSELIHEANLWACDRSESSTVKTMPQVNGRLEDKDDTNIDMCLEQLARAISAHVTDILMERLGLEERSQQRADVSTAMDLSTVSTIEEPPHQERPRNLMVKPSTSRSMPNTARSLPQSPTPSRRRSQTYRRGNEFNQSSRHVDSAERMSSTTTTRKGGSMMRYHSENRLNRIEPPPGINETPLENRASRLRRASIGKKLNAVRDRSLQRF